MRLVIATEAHFSVVNGLGYSSLSYESFWRRYQRVFDSVLIIARAVEIDHIPQGEQLVTKKDIKLIILPRYHGPYQYIRQMRNIHKIIRDTLHQGDAFILHAPGNIGTLVWKQLPPGYPFGIELKGDPWEAFAPGSVKSLGRRFFRWQWSRNLKKQCQQAVAASYVTEHTLQRRYPPNKMAFTTHYSSVNLKSNWICTNPDERLARIKTIPARLRGDGPPVRLGFIGSFSLGHKRPDIHIQAVARCVAQGAYVVLDMIGDGPMVSDMKKLARRLKIADRVLFRGRIPGGKPIFDALDTFDLFINATATEGLPRVVIEAMARGCPCIGSDIGGIPELVEPGFLVPVFNATALADKITQILKKPKKMADAVSRNINHARNYCREILQPRRRAFYRALRERTENYLSSRHRNGS